MSDVPAVDWSASVEQAEWIAERLAPFGTGLARSVVPGGFEAYARLLHPAERAEAGRAYPVRWAEVAAWSGLPLRPDSPFASIALPRQDPQQPAPWRGGPREGSWTRPTRRRSWTSWRRTPARRSAAGSVSGKGTAGTTHPV